MKVFFILFFILGLVIYHAMFDIWYLNFQKAIFGEILGAGIFSIIMTAFTIKYWWLACGIIILLGLILGAKSSNPTIRLIIIGVFGVFAIVTASIGINYNKQEQQKKSDEEMKKTALLQMDFNSSFDDLSQLVVSEKSYVLESDSRVVYAKVWFSDIDDATYRICFADATDEMIPIQYYYYDFKCSDDVVIYHDVKNENNYLDLTDAINKGFTCYLVDENEDFSGFYRFATPNDVSNYNAIYENQMQNLTYSENSDSIDYLSDEEPEIDLLKLQQYAGYYEGTNYAISISSFPYADGLSVAEAEITDYYSEKTNSYTLNYVNYSTDWDNWDYDYLLTYVDEFGNIMYLGVYMSDGEKYIDLNTESNNADLLELQLDFNYVG